MSTIWKTMGEVTLGDVMVLGGYRVMVQAIDPVSLKPGRVDVRGIDERGGDFWMYSVRQDWPVKVRVA